MSIKPEGTLGIRITSGGNVGIGTSSPDYKLTYPLSPFHGLIPHDQKLSRFY